MAELESTRRVVGMEEELDDPRAVTQIDEDQPAVIAAPVDPARDTHLGAGPVAQHLAAPGIPIAVGLKTVEIAHASRPGDLGKQVAGVDRTLLAA